MPVRTDYDDFEVLRDIARSVARNPKSQTVLDSALDEVQNYRAELEDTINKCDYLEEYIEELRNEATSE